MITKMNADAAGGHSGPFRVRMSGRGVSIQVVRAREPSCKGVGGWSRKHLVQILR